MHSIVSDKIAFSLDGKGRLVSLLNNSTGHDYAGGGSLWRLIYSHGLEMEKLVSGDDNVPQIEVVGSVMRLVYSKLVDVEGTPLDIELILTAEVEGDEIHFSAEIANYAQEVVVREIHFPLVRRCRISSGQRLVWSLKGGERFDNILETVRSHHTEYMAKDNLEVRMSALYPGFAATNSFVLENANEGLYFGSHDSGFQYTLHLLAADADGLIATMVKYPFVAAGESWRAEGYVLSPYGGSWHVAAKKYRRWAEEWFCPQSPLKMVEEMNGWQRIIMRHQYGEVHYGYDQIEQVFQEGSEAGIDTLFMFGWWRDGMDAGYPDYAPDESQGGFAALKENIQKLHAAGGKIILYFNGQLIDMATDFYHRAGKRISVKKADGNEHMEVYPFGGNGTALRLFGNKTFVTACPSSEEWHEILKGCIDLAADLGADAVFFDQLGWMSQPCHDASHGHPVPFMNPMKTKAKMLERLQKHVKERNPDMGLGIEWFSDVTAQHVDFIHSMDGGSRALNDWKLSGDRPRLQTFMDWFYYIFPEIRASDREIRDDTDVERRVNRAILKGLRSDVEIYRCRRTIAETPGYRKYLGKANQLRDRYRHLILNGRFCDTDCFELDNPEMDASCFSDGDEVAVVLAQSHRDLLSAKLRVPGFVLLGTDGLNDYRVQTESDGSFHVDLSRDGLALLHLRAAGKGEPSDEK